MSVAQTEIHNRTNPAFCATGIWSPMLMPLQENLDIDLGRMLALGEELLSGGCHGLALFGTTSEANSFSVEERMLAFDTCVKAGIAPERIMVGNGCCAYPDTLQLTRQALDAGCTKVLMLPPFYYKNMSDEGLANSFSLVIDKLKTDKLRIFLYHFPALSAVPITHGLINILRQRHGDIIAGVKDSTGDWNSTRKFLEAFPDLAILPGTERLLLEGLQHGAAGSITATANLTSSAIRAVYDGWNENAADVAERQDHINRIREAIQQTPMVPTLKYLTSVRLDDPAWDRLRPPMVNLSPEQGQASVAALQAAGLELG